MSVDTTGDPGAATVVVQVRESKLQKLVLGIGVNTDTGARFSVEHTHHQLPLIGWRAVSNLLLDGSKKSLGTELTGPPTSATGAGTPRRWWNRNSPAASRLTA